MGTADVESKDHSDGRHDSALNLDSEKQELA